MRDLKNKVQEQLWDCIKSSVFCVRFVHSSPNIFRDNHHFISARMDIYTKQSVIIFIFMCILHASNINTRHNYSAGLNFDRYVWFQSILFQISWNKIWSFSNSFKYMNNLALFLVFELLISLLSNWMIVMFRCKHCSTYKGT